MVAKNPKTVFQLETKTVFQLETALAKAQD